MPELERIECTFCGAKLEISSDGKSGKCRYCGSEYHFKEEKGPALVMALNNAAGYLKRHDFDSAIVNYESVLKEYPKDAEAAWGHVISTYGIVFEKDDRTGQMIPTCSRIVKESILENKSYKLAISECAEEQRPIYEKKASLIDKVQKRIKRIMEDEEDFDVFISFKANDEKGASTEDSLIARNIYDELQKKGIKAFFSEVTLADRIGDEYEPIIYRALYSCKFFIFVATREEYIEAPWVKNEWTRFRDRIAEENLSGACSAVFKNISPYSLPKIFQNQGVDLEKHPYDYARLVADNLALKFGLKSKEQEELEELRRRNAELEEQRKQNAALEEKLRRLEEAQSNPTPTAAMDMKAFAEMMQRVEDEKKRAEEARRKEEESKRKAAEEAKRKAEEEAKRKAAEEAKRKAAEEARRKAAEEAKRKAAKDFTTENGCLKKYNGTDRDVTIPDGVTSIGNSAFRGCSSLTSITIPNSVTSIGERAFYECKSLTSITIPNSVTSIGELAFLGSESLKSVIIPDSVTSIGYAAFDECKNLSNIIVEEKNNYYKSIDGNLYTKDGKSLVQYAIGKPSSQFAIPNGVTSIDERSFSCCKNLKWITIPDSVTSIGYAAFSRCGNLEIIKNSDSVISIGEQAFWNCKKLEKIAIPDGVTSIGARAFVGCYKLTIYVSNPENINNWDKQWNPDSRPVLNPATGKPWKKALFGGWK